jgi:hypothetical protein
MRSLHKFVAISGSVVLLLAALSSNAQAQGQSQTAEMGRVISSTPLVQPNQSHPTAYNVVYEYAGKRYNVQLPRDPGAYVQLQVTPVGAQQVQQYEQPVSIPAPVIQPQTIYVPPTPQVVYAPQPVVYQQPYYVNPYIYPAIGIGIGYAAYRFGGYGYRGGGGFRGHGHR